MSIAEIPKPTDRAEWLAERHKFANASDAAVYVGCHPYKSLADLVIEKLAETPPDITNRAMERGNRLEQAIADWWADEQGVAIYAPEVMYAAGRILATLDFRIVRSDREALEVKSTTKRIDEPEPYWFWQVQAQMLCADLDRVHIAALDGTMDLKSYTVERDDDAITRLVEAVEHVWAYLDLGMTPDGVVLNAEQVATLYPEPVHDAVEVDDAGFQAVVRFAQAKLARLDAEKAEKDAKDEVARLIGERDALSYAGRVVCTWEAAPRTSLDVKRLQAELPEVAAKFERTTTVRTMRLAKNLEDADG